MNVSIVDDIPTSSAWYPDPCTRLPSDSRALSLFLLPVDDDIQKSMSKLICLPRFPFVQIRELVMFVFRITRVFKI